MSSASRAMIATARDFLLVWGVTLDRPVTSHNAQECLAAKKLLPVVDEATKIFFCTFICGGEIVLCNQLNLFHRLKLNIPTCLVSAYFTYPSSKSPMGNIWNTRNMIGQFLHPLHSKLTSQIFFFTPSWELATAQGFLMARGATKAACHCPLVSCEAPPPVRSKAKTYFPPMIPFSAVLSSYLNTKRPSSSDELNFLCGIHADFISSS